MKNFRNHYNYKHTAKDKEHPSGPSLTVENQAYTIREILEKFTRGAAPSVAFKPVYESNGEDFDQINETMLGDFDLTDASEAIAKLETDYVNRIQLLKSKVADKKQSEAKRAPKKTDITEPDQNEPKQESEATSENGE